ncbi:hypothetical protein SCHPADRAFT_880215 [Schizopora paradoxa]|uniref:EXPERA domain-containing protein n=1 Tax=Schizopora paradoxa TaxID=27342 RepID=A0A0H2RBA0_9AGAM|nr:hypothetical protein SCHPADRAFT_880215 [Schizopora paradoxa]
MSSRRPLRSRPLDLLYLCFFASHIPATLFFDGQAVYPSSLVPQALKDANAGYLAWTRDPLIGNIAEPESGFLGAWFRSFVILELVFQLPTFFVGIRGLWKDSRSIYPLLLIYGASTATATLACIASFLASPTSPSDAELLTVANFSIAAPTASQIRVLLGLYMPYLIVPLLMTIDMAQRIGKLMGRASKGDKDN